MTVIAQSNFNPDILVSCSYMLAVFFLFCHSRYRSNFNKRCSTSHTKISSNINNSVVFCNFSSLFKIKKRRFNQFMFILFGNNLQTTFIPESNSSFKNSGSQCLSEIVATILVCFITFMIDNIIFLSVANVLQFPLFRIKKAFNTETIRIEPESHNAPFAHTTNN